MKKWIFLIVVTMISSMTVSASVKCEVRGRTIDNIIQEGTDFRFINEVYITENSHKLNVLPGQTKTTSLKFGDKGTLTLVMERRVVGPSSLTVYYNGTGRMSDYKNYRMGTSLFRWKDDLRLGGVRLYWRNEEPMNQSNTLTSFPFKYFVDIGCVEVK